MRIDQRILLVAALTVVLTAAGFGLVTFRLSPLSEQAATKPHLPDEIEDDLPDACLDELAALENSGEKPDATALTGALAARARAAASDPAVPRAARRGSVADQTDERDAGVVLTPQSPPSGSDAVARPIAPVRSAEWNDPASPTAASVATPRPANTSTLAVSVEEPLPSEALDSLKSVDVLDLMRQLRSDALATRNSARRELLRRGFSEVDLELGRQLFSSDAAARKQLAMAVPRLASVDAAQWLMWLAADPLPDVRIAAITTLATSGDPALLDRVEAMARKDSDPQVQAIADQIAKQRDLSASRGVENPLR